MVNRAEQQRIRTYFGNALPRRIDGRVARVRGYDTAAELWEDMRALMETEQEEHRAAEAARTAQRAEAYDRKKEYNRLRNQAIRAAQRAEAEHAARVRDFQRRRLGRLLHNYAADWSYYFPIAELPARLARELRNVPGFDNRQPFTFTLSSGVIDGLVAPATRIRNLEYHFPQWFRATFESESGLDSSTGFTFHTSNIRTDVWSMVHIDHVALTGGGASGDNDRHVTLDLKHYIFETFSPKNQRNDCAFRCLDMLAATTNGLPESDHHYRKKHGLLPKTVVTPEVVLSIYKTLGFDKFLVILTEDSKVKLDFKVCNYMLLHSNHYFIVNSAESKSVAPPAKATKRGWCFWDIETRKSDRFTMVGKERSYYLKDAILCAYYKNYKSNEWQRLVFTTNDEACSCRQFLDWLLAQAWDGKHYNCVAHNGARFDHYFLSSQFTQQEQLSTKINLRGLSVIGMDFANHSFRDSCCFITNSLENICKSYGVKNGKKTSFELRGQTLTNGNIWAYRPELSFDDFMQLEHEEPDYWEQYVDYCIYDCISLSEIWMRFIDETNGLIAKINSNLLRSCSVQSALTIGSLSKKIVDKLNKDKKCFNLLQEFIDDNEFKYKFVQRFKIGGISHCNQPGKHTHDVVSYDITSQYPTAMRHMRVPVGHSSFTEGYDDRHHGFYELTNLVWDADVARRFKIVCGTSIAGTRDWNNLSETTLMDSYMIKYMMAHGGLLSFDVVQGLVSTHDVDARYMFGHYVDVLFGEKARQDELKDAKSTEYNGAYREVIKLFLNALTGKLVEDSSKYFDLAYTTKDTKDTLGGIGCLKNRTGKKLNPWLVCGVIVYSYSKRLLHEYMRCMPSGTDDIINVETDSMYFDKKHQAAFIANVEAIVTDYPIKIGHGIDAPLGCVKQEYDEGGDSYFLGKKFYMIGDSMKIKGIPLKTKDAHGNDVQLVSEQLYASVYAGNTETRSFNTMKKNLFGETYISQHTMSRKVRPAYTYQLYT